MGRAGARPGIPRREHISGPSISNYDPGNKGRAIH
jgi:hypothetical protein